MTNVVSFPVGVTGSDRDQARRNLIERLRSMTRLPSADRATLAERLGEVAAGLAPKPLDGARVLFDTAWGRDNALWAKRKRYLRLPGEPASNPLDEGSYVSSGGSWAKLVETAAILRASGDAPNPDRELQRHVRNLLQGTCLLPQAPAMPTGAEGARELIDRVAARVVERVSRETKLPALFEILQTAPFTLAPIGSEGRPMEGLEAATAAFVSSLVPDSEQRWGFTGKPDWQGKLSLSWSFPSIMLGVLARRVKHRLFIVPESLHAVIQNIEYEDYEGKRPGPNEAKLDEWIGKLGGWKTNWGVRHLPDVEFTPQTGYGWKEIDVETTRSVFLEIRPRGTGVGAWLHVQADDYDDFVPVDLADLVRASLPHRRGWKDFCGSASPMSYEFSALTWPSWIEETYAQRRPLGFEKPKAGAIIGLLEALWVDWIGGVDVEGWLDDAENVELSSILFGGGDDVRFLATIAAGADQPVPCKPASIAAAMLRNIGAERSDRIVESLVDGARSIASAGHGYHEAVMEQHRILIDGM